MPRSAMRRRPAATVSSAPAVVSALARPLPRPPAGTGGGLELLLHMLLVGLAGGACFSGSLSGGFVYDDRAAVVENSDLRPGAFLPRSRHHTSCSAVAPNAEVCARVPCACANRCSREAVVEPADQRLLGNTAGRSAQADPPPHWGLGPSQQMRVGSNSPGSASCAATPPGGRSRWRASG